MRILALFLTLVAMPLSAETRVVFAAASLKEPLDAIAALAPGTVVTYGGSGTIARQVQLGAPADIVILAAPEWMQALIDGGQVQAGASKEILSNRLVLVAPNSQDVALNSDAIQQVLGDGRIALGFTDSVPAGAYAKAALTSLNLWDGVKNHLAEVDNVRAALALVARKEVPLGIVYASDAEASENVYVAAEFPDDSHPKIVYLAAPVGARSLADADFMQRLTSPEAAAIFQAAGFIPLGPL